MNFNETIWSIQPTDDYVPRLSCAALSKTLAHNLVDLLTQRHISAAAHVMPNAQTMFTVEVQDIPAFRHAFPKIPIKNRQHKNVQAVERETWHAITQREGGQDVAYMSSGPIYSVAKANKLSGFVEQVVGSAVFDTKREGSALRIIVKNDAQQFEKAFPLANMEPFTLATPAGLSRLDPQPRL